MQRVKFSASPRFSAALVVLALASALAGCGSGIDPGYSRRPRFSTSAPLTNAKRDPSYLSYAVPESDLHRYPATRSAEFAVHGVDVSKYQGEIDWQQVKDSGVAFAFIKATEGGDNADSRFARNWAGARAAGVPRGAYHFVYWCRPWHEEIAQFERIVPNEPDALPPVLDVEATPTSRTCKRTLYREEVLEDMRKMLAEMERHYGKKPIIYSSVDFYQSILHSNALAEYPIWVRSTKYHPVVRYGDRRWTFWQYRSDGSVPGISGNVDQNCFQGTPDHWRQWVSLQTGGALAAAPVWAPRDDRPMRQLIEDHEAPPTALPPPRPAGAPAAAHAPAEDEGAPLEQMDQAPDKG
jgi:lysozyme